MTNPNNAIGTNGAYGGRTSVNAFNDNLAIYQSRGILSGFVVSPDSGMDISIGGDGTTRDVAIAEDNVGNKTTINNISESPITLTIAGAPVNNSRIDAIVAYVDNPAQGSATETDNPSACGLIAVQGVVSATPSQPDENAIRTAITADGASGTNAYYVVLGYITITNGTTDITSNMIMAGSNAKILGNNIADGSITSDKIGSATICTDITSSITWSEDYLNASAYLMFGKYVLINYMGESITHSIGQRIATIPSAYRPSQNVFVLIGYGPVIGNGVVVADSGQLNCNAVHGASSTAYRANFFIVYPIV